MLAKGLARAIKAALASNSHCLGFYTTVNVDKIRDNAVRIVKAAGPIIEGLRVGEASDGVALLEYRRASGDSPIFLPKNHVV